MLLRATFSGLEIALGATASSGTGQFLSVGRDWILHRCIRRCTEDGEEAFAFMLLGVFLGQRSNFKRTWVKAEDSHSGDAGFSTFQGRW